METRVLGRSGLRVTRLGLGLAALGRPGYINLSHAADLGADRSVERLEAHAYAVLDAAWAGGVRYFDAARSYGRGEAFLGAWLRAREIDPAQVTIGSKWGYIYTANWQIEAEVHEVKEHTLPVLQQQRAESDKNLGPYLRLYQIHSATVDSGVLQNADVLRQLADYRAAGLAIGLTLSGPRQSETLRRALDVEIDGAPLFDTVQATWNLLEPSAGAALADAHAAGMGVIVKEALANGRLTASNTRPQFAAQRVRLEALAAQKNTTLDALALAATLAQPWADVVLSGAARIEHLNSNLAALDVAWSEDDSAALADLAETPTAYWEIRSDLDWR